MSMRESSDQESIAEEVWRTYLTTGEFEDERRQRRLFRFLPGSPRCKICYAPFGGAGSAVVRLIYNKWPSNMNPHLCNSCEQFAREYPGGAEVELSLLFADVRGSTSLAESLGTARFSQLINRFYKIASQTMVDSDALIDKIMGDQVAGIYVPGFAGAQHSRRAVEAGRKLLAATGHNDVNGPWIPLGVGIHTGTAYVGSVGSKEATMDITVLGDAPNTAARLASQAKTGEILISEQAYQAANLDLGILEVRQLALKGKSQSVSVHVLAGTSDRQLAAR
jgi:adenylate cyclase